MKYFWNRAPRNHANKLISRGRKEKKNKYGRQLPCGSLTNRALRSHEKRTVQLAEEQLD
jgi:hypothetical protein